LKNSSPSFGPLTIRVSPTSTTVSSSGP